MRVIAIPLLGVSLRFFLSMSTECGMLHRYDAISRVEKAQSTKSGDQSATMDAMMKQMAPSAGSRSVIERFWGLTLKHTFGSASTLGSILALDEPHGDRANCSIDKARRFVTYRC